MFDLGTIVALNNNAAANIGPQELKIRDARLDRALRANPRPSGDTAQAQSNRRRATYRARSLARRIALLAPLVGLDPKVAEDRAVLAAFVTLADSNPSFFARS